MGIEDLRIVSLGAGGNDYSSFNERTPNNIKLADLSLENKPRRRNDSSTMIIIRTNAQVTLPPSMFTSSMAQTTMPRFSSHVQCFRKTLQCHSVDDVDMGDKRY